MGLASPGVGSNLDVNTIISSLMEIEKRPLLLIGQKEAGFQAKLSAYGSLKGALSSFQSAVKDLSSPSKYQSLFAVPADLTRFTASADTTAVPGNYSLEITKLAANQKLVAVGQANNTDTIGNGTLTFDFGTISGGTFSTGTGKYTGSSFTSNGAGASTVTIDATNNSLSGIRDAINTAKIGITATIINDGSALPERLSLTSDKIGLKNSIKVTVAGDAALVTILAHDPAGTQNLSETVTAADADLKVDGISITKSSNTITDIIQGVTLNLLKTTTTGSPVNLAVSQDKSTVKDSVAKFVAEFEAINKIIGNLTDVDSDTLQVGLLQGDTSVLSIETQIKRIMTSSVPALTGSLKSLTDIGVSFQKDGTLALDSTKLQAAVDNHYNELAGIFVSQGKPTDSLIKFISSTDKTDPGSYAVNITTMATQGKTVGSATAGLTITSGSNDTLNITVDGASATITLAAATYASATALATELQSKINGSSTFSTAGVAVTVSESSGVLTITSKGYGAASKVDITGGNGEVNLVGASSSDTNGLNVAGTINGAASTGFGQFLTISAGNAAEGLKIQVIGGATGSRGTLTYSEGYAFQLETLTNSLLGTTGTISTRTDGLNTRINDLNDQRDDINSRLFDIEARYRKQFASLDILLSSFQATSNFLSQQLDQLAKIPKSGSSI